MITTRHIASHLPQLAIAAAVAMAAAGCGLGKRGEPEGPSLADNPFGPTGVPPQLRSRASVEGGGTAIAPGGNQPALPRNVTIVAEENLVFTDPDNPDAGIPELTELLVQPTRRGPWEESETVARRRAMRENKPMMIWFTDSARSPMCKALGEELFATPEFNDWADEHLVRLRIDTNLANVGRDLSTIDEGEAMRDEVRHYNQGLRKRFRILGNPSVVMLDAEGRVLTRYRGYRRGEAEVFFGKIRHTESIAAKNNESWRKNMESRGYREWSDARGSKTIFARLLQFHEGTLVLVEPDGTRSRTRETHLSAADRAWIAAEKTRRGR